MKGDMKSLLVAMFLGLMQQAATAQSPAPSVVSALSTAAAPSSQTAEDLAAVRATISQLEQMKAVNDDILSKQKAALERLDEMQEAAEQMKAFSKRG
jgi:hypothetical protein